MKIVEPSDFHKFAPDGCVLTIGNFDGVHRGHQQLLAQGGLLAANTGLPLAVLTFEPHPLTVIAPDKAPPRLTTPQDKLTKIAAAGADITAVAASTRDLLAMEPEAFVRDVIVKQFHASHIVEGPSFSFGRARRGTVQLLADLGKTHGFEVCQVGPVELQIEPHATVLVSSSVIRNLIEQGKVHRAALCLGRPYVLTGTVQRGHKRGAGLGFPTINLHVDDLLVPANGVYAGLGQVESAPVKAAISIGTCPTFGAGQRQVEAFLLDFDDDVYGQQVCLEFHHWLRPQEKYPSADALAEQMARDVADVRRCLAGNNAQPRP